MAICGEVEPKVFHADICAGDVAGCRERYDKIKQHIGVFVAAAKYMTWRKEPNFSGLLLRLDFLATSKATRLGYLVRHSFWLLISALCAFCGSVPCSIAAECGHRAKHPLI